MVKYKHGSLITYVSLRQVNIASVKVSRIRRGYHLQESAMESEN